MKEYFNQIIDNPIVNELDKIDLFFEKYFISSDEDIFNVIKFLSKQSGKKIRPLMLLLSAEIAGGYSDISLKYATIMEVLHTASLIHDDIIDVAELRRGEKSVNQEFGNKLAVLVGDFLFSRSLSLLAQEKNIEIIQIYSKTSENLCLGEVLEQKIANENEWSQDRYFEAIKLKTGSLFSASCKIGVVSGNGSIYLQNQMKDFGENFGIAFQLKDDLLDFLGEKGDTGKNSGKDVSENIYTYPLLSILLNINEQEQVEINHNLDNVDFDDHFEVLKSIIEKKGGFRKTEKKILEYSEKCNSILDKLEYSPNIKSLKKLVQFNIDRKS